MSGDVAEDVDTASTRLMSKRRRPPTCPASPFTVAQTDDADATVVEISIGIRIAFAFEANDGKKFEPTTSLAVVPACGDKDIDVTAAFAGASQSMNYRFTDDVTV